ncbi:hypothetical protein [Sphingobacterium faecium]|uniref:hypothetical protein n=1 Tax=Sphingobacterium faecium TaxID=34087 RepID=UPI003208FFAE
METCPNVFPFVREEIDQHLRQAKEKMVKEMDNETEEIAFYLSVREEPKMQNYSASMAINNARIIKKNERPSKSLTFKI